MAQQWQSSSEIWRFTSQFPSELLTHVQVLELAKTVQANWEGEGSDRHLSSAGIKARNTICIHNVRLIPAHALRWRDRGLDLSDLLTEGYLGLTQAAEKFDPSKGYRFSTYAHGWIISAIQRSVFNKGSSIRLSVNAHENHYQMLRAAAKLRAQWGKVPTIEEIAAVTGLSIDRLTKLTECFATLKTASLNHKVGKDEDTELGDIQLDLFAQTPDDYVENLELKEAIAQSFEQLTEQQRFVLSDRYLSGSPTPIADLGRKLGVRRACVANIQRAGLDRLSKTQLRDWRHPA